MVPKALPAQLKNERLGTPVFACICEDKKLSRLKTSCKVADSCHSQHCCNDESRGLEHRYEGQLALVDVVEIAAVARLGLKPFVERTLWIENYVWPTRKLEQSAFLNSKVHAIASWGTVALEKLRRCGCGPEQQRLSVRWGEVEA